MDKKREIINTKGQDGQPIELAVILPNHRINQEIGMYYSLKVSQLIREGTESGGRLLLRSEVEDYLIKAKIWTNQDALSMEKLGLTIKSIELMLKRGGISKWEARTLAIQMGQLRNKMMELFNKKQQLDTSTVEAVAENYKFAMLMIKCTVYVDTGKPFFVNYEDYLERGAEIAVIDVATFLSKFVYGVTDDVNNTFFENRWLKEAGFINKQGRYTNEEGKLINQEGQCVDEFGRLVNDDGDLVNKQGVKIDCDGEFIVKDAKPFIGKDGKEEFICQQEPRKNSKKKVVKKKNRKKRKVTVKK